MEGRCHGQRNCSHNPRRRPWIRSPGFSGELCKFQFRALMPTFEIITEIFLWNCLLQFQLKTSPLWCTFRLMANEWRNTFMFIFIFAKCHCEHYEAATFCEKKWVVLLLHKMERTLVLWLKEAMLTQRIRFCGWHFGLAKVFVVVIRSNLQQIAFACVCISLATSLPKFPSQILKACYKQWTYWIVTAYVFIIVHAIKINITKAKSFTRVYNR